MRISLRILCSVVALAVALCTLTMLVRVNATKQNADKLIHKRKEAPNQPVEILEIKNAKQLLKANFAFHDDDEWLKGFSLKMKNKSLRNIVLISVELLFPRGLGQSDPPIADTIVFGTEQFGTTRSNTQQLILPAQSLTVSLSDQQYLSIRELLRTNGYGEELKSVIVTVDEVAFDDGTKWHAGFFMQRDPANRGRWIPIGKVQKPVLNHHPALRPAPAIADRLTLLGLDRKQGDFSFLLVPFQTPRPCEGRWLETNNIACLDSGCTSPNDTMSTFPYKTSYIEVASRPCKKSNGDTCVNLKLTTRAGYCPLWTGGFQDESECENAGGYWNFSMQECQGEPASCPVTCWEGGLDIDFCQYETGCPPGFAPSAEHSATCCDPVSPPCPVAIDVDGKGFHFTDANGGVDFDIDGDGDLDHISWVAPTSTNAWLALDRNANGTIDSGVELFGNYTVQPATNTIDELNGFRALAEFDKPTKGGNGDGLITPADSIYLSLRLWQDSNHNGISEPSELKTLQALGLNTIELSYKASKQTDPNGNEFRYRSKVKDAKGNQVGRWAWDVFLVKQ